jgi:hypothetical protein
MPWINDESGTYYKYDGTETYNQDPTGFYTANLPAMQHSEAGETYAPTTYVKAPVSGNETPEVVSSNDVYKVQREQKKKEFDDFVSSKPSWQQPIYSQITNWEDPYYRNISFAQNPDGKVKIIKSALGGDAQSQLNYANENLQDDLWAWDYADGKATNPYYREGEKTTGNSFAPYFLAAGTLLTGGMLAPIMAGAGLAGGALIGAGLGAGSSAAGQMISNQGQIGDWGSIAMGAGTGALGGAIAGSGGLSNMFGGDGGYTYGDLGDASSWADYWGEGDFSYGDLGNQGSWEDYWGDGDYSYGDFANEGEWADYWNENGISDTELDIAMEAKTGMNLEDLAKKVGMKAAGELAKQIMGGSAPIMPPTGGTMSGYGNMWSSAKQAVGSSIPSLDIDQKLLAYKQAQLDPEFWRFMSSEEA